MFNFRAEELEDPYFTASNRFTETTLLMFSRTVKAVHTRSVEVVGLPIYEGSCRDDLGTSSKEEQEFR